MAYFGRMQTDTNDWVQLERAALYEQVWNEPLTLLAPRYGLSDVVCVLNIRPVCC